MFDDEDHDEDDWSGSTQVEDRVDEVAAQTGEGLDKAGGAMGERADHADEAVKVLAGTAKTVSNAAALVGDVREAVDAFERGDVVDGTGAVVGGGAGLAGSATGVASALDPVLREAGRQVTGVVQQVGGVTRGVGSALRGPIEQLVQLIDGNSAKAVSYEVETDAFPGEELNVGSLKLVEALSEPYRLDIDLASEDADFDPLALLGRNLVLSIRRGDAHVRRTCGLVRKVVESSLQEGNDETSMHLEVVPALALLALRRDSRTFQAKSVPEILTEVLDGALSPYGRSARLELTGTYLAREYCLQFDESDLDFAHRLMEEEGITYAFDHDGDVEVMILSDDNAAFERVETADGGETIPFIPRADTVRSQEPIFSFHPVHRAVSTSAVLRDFDWTQQGDMRLEEERREEDALGRDREVYEHRTRAATITDYDQGVAKYQAHDVAQQVRVRHELQRLPARTGEGVSRVIGFAPGRTIEMTGHPSLGADGEYLLTRVVHEKAPLPTAGVGEVEIYHNRFECIPFEVPFRPARRTEKPRIHSIQTAVVVGPAGEETDDDIHTDEHGRVKVEFHWDRIGERDARSSCWVRVQQPWAGSGWGFVFIPRIGMEVLVSFLDGDPDRPLVIGTVYNGDNLPPYPLPDEKTKSTIKTNSSPGGGGYNELRFEDAKGSEEIFTHAQKNYNEVVEHDHTTTVHNDQTNTVDGNQIQTVKKNQIETVNGEQTMTVDRNRTVRIKGSQSVTIDGSEPNAGLSGSKLDITGDYQIDASDWIEVQAPTRIKLTCGGSSILIEPGVITLVAGGRAKVVLDANALMQSAAESKVLLDGDAEVKANSGAVMNLTANADIKSNAASQVLLDGDAKVIASTGANVQLTADAKVNGANSEMIGSSTAKVGAPTSTLAGEGGSVEAGGSGVTAAGGDVNLSGGMVNIAGGLVKIN